MPENIAKVFRPSNKKNGERKGSGSWYNDTEKERFNHIKRDLYRYCYNDKDYDFLDLQWHIKNAVIGDIFFSEEVYNGINNREYLNKYFGKNTDSGSIVKGILEGKTRKSDGSFDEKFLEIQKFKGGGLIFEHVVPTKLYVDELIRAYKDKKFNEDYFTKFRKNIFVCIVTKEEDSRLNRNKLREKMPSGIKWEPGKNTFARYEKVGIKIHGRD